MVTAVRGGIQRSIDAPDCFISVLASSAVAFFPTAC